MKPRPLPSDHGWRQWQPGKYSVGPLPRPQPAPRVENLDDLAGPAHLSSLLRPSHRMILLYAILSLSRRSNPVSRPLPSCTRVRLELSVNHPTPEHRFELRFEYRLNLAYQMVPTIGCRVEPPGPAKKPGSPTFNTTAAYQERVLRILSFVLLSIHNRSYRSQDPAFPTGNWSPKALAEYIREANALLDKAAPSGPNDMSRCVVMVLQAYFLFLSGDRTQAVVVAEKLVDLVADNPLVLQLTIVSSLVGSVRSLLECADRTIAVERLQSAMEPLSSRTGLTNGGSKIEKELTSTFVAKQRNSGRGGAAAASAAAAAAAQPSRESILAKQK